MTFKGYRVDIASSHIRRLLLGWVLLFCAAGTVQAQKPPGLGYVFPPTLKIGETTDVRLGGFDYTRDLEWFVHDAHAQLTILGEPGEYLVLPPPYWFGPRASTPALPIAREIPARLAIDSGATEGLIRLQVANANGSSSAAAFYVSRGHEIVERRSRDFPQELPGLPVAVSGRLSRLTEVDRYELTADRDGLVTVELFARRLGADFHGVVQARGADGELLADFADTQGQDGKLTFRVAKGQAYGISLHDVDFRGDTSYVYRLAVRYGPSVVATRPASARRGTETEIEFIGYGVATGERRLETARRSVLVPAEPGPASFVYELDTPYGTAPVTIPLSDILESVATAPVVGETTPALVPPVAVTAVLPATSTAERFVWQAEPDEHWSIHAESRAIGGSLDVAVTVYGPQGEQVAENDDLAGSSDAGLQFKSTASGLYACEVRSMSPQQGRADEVFRLRIERATPDFTLSAPQQIALPSGGKVEVPVQVTRLGGFADEISLSVDGLPEGVTTDGAWVVPAGKNEAKVTIVSAGTEAVVARVLRIRGAATIGEAKVERVATAGCGGNLAPRRAEEARLDKLLLAMTMPAPIDVLVIDRERQRDVHRGTTYLAELEIIRKDGFTGPVDIEMTAQQARYRMGIRGPIVHVPADAGRTHYPCFMPEWLGTDLTRRMVVHGVVGVPDPRGNVRYLTKAADARITMIMEGALLKLSSPSQKIAAACGEAVEIPLTVSRSTKLPLEVRIELVVPEEIAGLVQAEPLVLAPGTDGGVLRITSQSDARLEGPWTFTITATALQEGRWPVVSQADVSLVFIPR